MKAPSSKQERPQEEAKAELVDTVAQSSNNTNTPPISPIEKVKKEQEQVIISAEEEALAMLFSTQK